MDDLALSLDSANILTLDKLHLINRVDPEGLAQIVSDMIGIHSSRFKSPIFSLVSRLTPFSLEEIVKSLNLSRMFIKIRCMRGTLHISTINDAPILHKATIEKRKKTCLYLMKKRGFSEIDYEYYKSCVIEALSKRQMSIDELWRSLRSFRIADLFYLKLTVRRLWEEGILCYINISNIWDCEKKVFCVKSNIYPSLNLDLFSPEEAKRRLILKYFESYGPATVIDAAWWSGIGINLVKEVIYQNESDFVSVRIKGLPDHYFMKKRDIDMIDKIKIIENEVRFLAYEDNLLKGYKLSRKRFIDEDRISDIYNGAGEALPSILYRGKIIGKWEFSQEINSFKINLFTEPKRDIKNSIENEAKNVSFLLNKSKTPRFLFKINN